MTPEEELRRGAEARQLLDTPLFVAARSNLSEQLASLRRDVPIGATDMHTRLILMEQLVERFFGYFEQLAQTGRMAQITLAEEQQRKSLAEQGLAMFRRFGRNGV